MEVARAAHDKTVSLRFCRSDCWFGAGHADVLGIHLNRRKKVTKRRFVLTDCLRGTALVLVALPGIEPGFED